MQIRGCNLDIQTTDIVPLFRFLDKITPIGSNFQMPISQIQTIRDDKVQCLRVTFARCKLA